MCQVSNGKDFLGVVLFRLVASPGKPACVERFVLECLRQARLIYVTRYILTFYS